MDESELGSWVGSYSDLDQGDRYAAVQLVVEGGAVVGTREQIASRLANVRVLALLRESPAGRIVGVASLKQPNAGYRSRTFAMAGFPIAGFEEAPELGYVVVASRMRGRGLSDRLVGLIVTQIREPAFATTHNPIMKANLSRFGFLRAGAEWTGQKDMLSLWTFTPP